jgi:hypothetical protein
MRSALRGGGGGGSAAVGRATRRCCTALQALQAKCRCVSPRGCGCMLDVACCMDAACFAFATHRHTAGARRTANGDICLANAECQMTYDICHMSCGITGEPLVNW